MTNKGQNDELRTLIDQMNAGNSEKAYELGELCEQGKVPAGITALTCYKEAAKKGHAKAQYKLGKMAQNNFDAYVWFDLAVKNGYTKAAKERDKIGQYMDKKQIAQAKARSKNCLNDTKNLKMLSPIKETIK